MSAIARSNAFVEWMNAHRDDAWGDVIQRFLAQLQRSEQTVTACSTEAVLVKAYHPTWGEAPTPSGSYDITLTFTDGCTARTRIIPRHKRIGGFRIDDSI